MKTLVVFCDFDGTITMNDNIIAIMRHFQPEGWEAYLQQVMKQQITIQHAIGSMFALLPSRLKDEAIRFALDNMQIRPGFAEFLEYCQAEQIVFLVTSGGIDFFVNPTLLPFGIQPEQIYCNASDFGDSHMTILWPHSCGEACDLGCGMCKATLIRAYPPDQYTRILIGDSITDFAGAKLADIIFARSHLAEQCTNLQMPFFAYESFFEIIAQMRSIHYPI